MRLKSCIPILGSEQGYCIKKLRQWLECSQIIFRLPSRPEQMMAERINGAGQEYVTCRVAGPTVGPPARTAPNTLHHRTVTCTGGVRRRATGEPGGASWLVRLAGLSPCVS